MSYAQSLWASSEQTALPSPETFFLGANGTVLTRFPLVATKVNFDADSSEEPRWFDVADPAFGSQY